jgi:hypothetical protein
MNLRRKNLAAMAGLAFAVLASANSASAQAVSDPTLVQPTAVAPVSAPAAYPATTAYPATSAYPAGAVQAQPYAAGPPPMMGAVSGTTAADRDGDGIVDGYYTSDGFYHPYVAPAPAAPAPRYLSRRGERG